VGLALDQNFEVAGFPGGSEKSEANIPHGGGELQETSGRWRIGEY
jgi:hypothetical protein